MNAEMELAKALASVPTTDQEKLAAHFESMNIDEIEDFLRKEGIGTRTIKTASALDLSPEEKLRMADSWGRELAKEAAKGQIGKSLRALGRGVQTHMKENPKKYMAGAAAPSYLYGVHRGRKIEQWYSSPEGKKEMRELERSDKALKKKSEITKLSGPFGSMVSKLAPTITKGMQTAKGGLATAGKALKGTSMAGRAIAGGVAGMAGGAASAGGVDPMTGQPKSRLMGALKGGVVGAGLGAGAPKMLAGGQKMLGKGIKAVGRM